MLTGHKELTVGVDVDVELNTVAGCEVVDICEKCFVFRCITCCLTYRKTLICVKRREYMQITLVVLSAGIGRGSASIAPAESRVSIDNGPC